MKTLLAAASLPTPLTAKGRALMFFAFTIVLASCLGPKKIDKWVSKQYDGAIPAVTKKKSDYITVTSTVASMGTKLSATEKKSSHLLPLIFYWQMDYKNTCTLNPQIPINNFTSTVQSYAGKMLKQKLNGQRIEMSIDKLPNIFAIDDKEHMIWFVYAYAWDYLTIRPQTSDMVVSYKLFKSDDTVTKTGIITVPNTDKGIALGMFQSVKKKTWEYLDQYNANITTMSKSVIDKLVAEL